jgi:hypothetical protein
MLTPLINVYLVNQKAIHMKNFREEQINTTDEYCINQYWEKDVIVNDINITFHYWKRKEGCRGYNGDECIMKVIGIKDNKKKQIRSVWSTSLGEEYCTKQMVGKFN